MEIEFLKLENGRTPVFDFLRSLGEKAEARVLKTLESIEQNPIGFIGLSGIIKKMAGYSKYNLYEIRIRHNKILYRILCCIKDSTIYLVHVFVKKTQKTPLSEIKTAINRISSYNLTSPKNET